MEMMNDENALPRSTGYRCGACCAPVGEPHFAGCMMASVDAAAGLAADMLDQLDHSRLPLAVTAAVGVLRTALARAAVSAATKPTADLSSLQRWSASRKSLGAMVREEDGSHYRVTDVQSLLATKPAAAPAVPEGWEIKRLEDGTIVVRHEGKGGVALGNKYNETIEANIFTYFIADLLAATPAASTTGAAQTAEQVWTQATAAAAELAIKFTAVPRDVLGPATVQMKAKAAVGEKLAVAILALTRPTPTHSSEAGDE